MSTSGTAGSTAVVIHSQPPTNLILVAGTVEAWIDVFIVLFIHCLIIHCLRACDSDWTRCHSVMKSASFD